jgi:phospholipid:diacylglycerol acyltransferase
LADVGYDGSSMSMESYDWRLSFPMLEERDGYLTKLKYKIEAFHKASGKKVVLTSHSLGALLVHYFFAWVTEEDKYWVDNHIHAYVNIAGAHLGVPKAASALLSGEMSDTIFMGAVGSLIEQFIGRKLRRDLFATWGTLYHMLPIGGDELWKSIITLTDGDGNPTNFESTDEYIVGEKMSLDEAIDSFGSQGYHPSSHVIDFLTKLGGGYHQQKAQKPWHDASKTPLPYAPNMKIYCLYGKLPSWSDMERFWMTSDKTVLKLPMLSRCGT